MLDSNKLAPACDSVNYWKGYTIISELANGLGDTGREFNIGGLRMGQNSKVTEYGRVEYGFIIRMNPFWHFEPKFF